MPIGVSLGTGLGIAASAVSAGTALAGALGGSSAVSSGSSQAQALDQQARQSGLDFYNADKANSAPYISTGQNALTQYANLSGLNGQDAANTAMSTFQASPGFQYQEQQGLKAIDNGAAARGLLNSGATLKAEQTLGSNLANQDFSNYMTRLSTLSGQGLTGAQIANQSTSTYDNLLAGTTQDQTGTIASAAGQQAGLYGNAAGAVGKLAQNALTAYGNSDYANSPKMGDGYSGTALDTGVGV